MNPRLLSSARLARSILRTHSDERLAELIAAGSDAAFEVLVARHRRSLVGLCTRIVGPTDAEEATQDALLRALDALRRGTSVDRVAPWLHVIARNVALNLRRSERARGECAPIDSAGGETAEDGSAARLRLAEVVAAVGALPDRQREAIVMRELEGRSYAEIAQRMQSSPGAVRQLLHRARAAMRERVAGLLGWVPFARWALGGAAGSQVGSISDACLATAKVCAALAPAAALGAGGLTVIERGAVHPPAPSTSSRTARHTAAVTVAAVRRAATTTTTTTPAGPAPATVSATPVRARLTESPVVATPGGAGRGGLGGGGVGGDDYIALRRASAAAPRRARSSSGTRVSAPRGSHGSPATGPARAVVASPARPAVASPAQPAVAVASPAPATAISPAPATAAGPTGRDQ